MVAASSRVLIVFSTAPVIGTPKCASTISGVFAATTDTVSPQPTPRADNAEASRWHRSRVCAQVNRRLPCTTASRSG